MRLGTLFTVLAAAVFFVQGCSGSQDTSFSVDNQGIITGNVTGLQWRLGPDSDTNWNEANSWINDLGGRWRMPSLSELSGLYRAGITALSWGVFSNSGVWVWSNKTKGSSSAWGLLFLEGNEDYNLRSSGTYKRVFAVRSR